MLPRIWWVWESHRVGVIASLNLACRRVMGTVLLHQGGGLGLVALGFHWVVSILRVVCVINVLFNPISSTKHTPHVSRVSDCHSSLVTTPSSRLILDKPKIEVTKALIHHIGKNWEHFCGENFIYDFPMSLKHIKEADCGDKVKLNYSTF